MTTDPDGNVVLSADIRPLRVWDGTTQPPTLIREERVICLYYGEDKMTYLDKWPLLRLERAELS